MRRGSIAITLSACALLTGCGTYHQHKTAPVENLQRACLNAKQLATLQREISNVTMPGDKQFALRSVVVWGGCYGKQDVHASIAQRTSSGEFEHITINREGRITNTGQPTLPGG